MIDPDTEAAIQLAVHTEVAKLVNHLRDTMCPGQTVDEWFHNALNWYLNHKEDK